MFTIGIQGIPAYAKVLVTGAAFIVVGASVMSQLEGADLIAADSAFNTTVGTVATGFNNTVGILVAAFLVGAAVLILGLVTGMGKGN